MQQPYSRDHGTPAVSDTDNAAPGYCCFHLEGSKHQAEAIMEGMGLSKPQLNLVEADTVPLNQVPDVSGMGVKDAVFALQKRGLRVRINGCGQIVKQDIAPGSVAVKGKQITLTASPK